MDTPFQWTKQVASHWAAPATARSCIGRRGSRRRAAALAVLSRDRHRADVLEVAASRAVNRARRHAEPVRGYEHGLFVQRARRAERHDLQYFEMLGNRGSTTRAGARSLPSQAVADRRRDKMVAFDDDTWELYDGSTDYSQATTGKEMPTD